MPRLWLWVEDAIGGQRGYLFPWVPVFFAMGIGAYFARLSDPSWVLIGWALAVGVICAAAAHAAGTVIRPVLIGAAILAAGFCMAHLRAHLVATPLIEFRYYGPIEGRIINIDRSFSDKPRLLLDQVVLQDFAPDRVPNRVRVSLHGDQRWITPEPGMRVMTTGHLSKSPGPAEPEGFDFQRHAWFQQIGAVGYTRVPALVLAPPDDGLILQRARFALSSRIQFHLDGQIGAFAAAITAGDRSAINQSTLDALRDSNLSHLLAISGLHMGLLTGFIFVSVRLALVLVPVWGLLWPVKKLAASAALIVGAGYLGLSGGNVATERAFIMVAVALLAVIFDRRVLSFRALALAALIVLALRPETLLGPGFQMSFAATTALVAVFGAWQKSPLSQKVPPMLRPILAVVLSSLVAGLATAPVAMAHFNRFAEYGLIANVIAVPAMGMIVIPAAVFAVLLMPFGLDWIGLSVMEWGLRWILGVAHEVSSWEKAVIYTMSPPDVVLPLGALAVLFIVLWQGRLRWLGLLPVALTVWIWTTAQRPDVLIAADGNLVGVMTDQGRALSKTKGSGFAARIWLENDGQDSPQARAADLWGGRGLKDIQHVSGKRAAQGFGGCEKGELVITNQPMADQICTVLGPDALKGTGAIALYHGKEKWRAVTARHQTGSRMWHGRLPPASAPDDLILNLGLDQ